MQSFELWHPVTDIPEHLSGAVVLQPGHNELLVRCDGKFKNGKRLVLSFGCIDAFQIRDDAYKPNEATGSKSGKFTFPFLKALNFNWAASASPAYHIDFLPVHYIINSLTYCMDVLSSHEPYIIWHNA